MERTFPDGLRRILGVLAMAKRAQGQPEHTIAVLAHQHLPGIEPVVRVILETSRLDELGFIRSRCSRRPQQGLHASAFSCVVAVLWVLRVLVVLWVLRPEVRLNVPGTISGACG